MSTGRDNDVIEVRSLNAAATSGLLRFAGLTFRCGLGRSGCRYMKREGDGATPLGTWALRQVFYRPDRLLRPPTRLTLRPLRPDDGWCDSLFDRNYNRSIRLPYAGRTEGMWREDNLYDLVVVVGYNDMPRVQGLGSAIFMHLARPGYAPSEGCVTLQKDHLLRLLSVVPANVALRVCE